MLLLSFPSKRARNARVLDGGENVSSSYDLWSPGDFFFRQHFSGPRGSVGDPQGRTDPIHTCMPAWDQEEHSAPGAAVGDPPSEKYEEARKNHLHDNIDRNPCVCGYSHAALV